jgi:hypothetical protein
MEFLKELLIIFQSDLPPGGLWLVGGASVVYLALLIYGCMQMVLHGKEPAENPTGIKSAIETAWMWCFGFTICWLMVGFSLGVIYAPVWFFAMMFQMPWGVACLLGGPIGFGILIRVYKAFGIH